eukprot:XP_016663069.1 PREDICTED: uncharacterized protein LOC103310429 [Acyrthosiphon pisum]
MTCTIENFKERYVRVQNTLAAMRIEKYDDNLTAVASLTSMLVVTVAGTSVMVVLALVLCMLCAGLAMTALVKSPAVQQALRRSFPGASGEVMTRCLSIASDCGRRATATISFGIYLAAWSVGTVMFVVVESLCPSNHHPLPVSRVEKPSPAAEAVTTANDAPLPAARADTTQVHLLIGITRN